MSTASPYKGLEPYGSEDRNRFFGRGDDRRILIAKLFSARVTLLFGLTGAGKSSLLGAGIIPELAEQGLDVSYHFKWNPREDPRVSLKASIKDSLFVLGRISSPEPPGWKGLTIKEFLERYSVFASDPFIIIIDQFEEFFLYHTHSSFFDDFIRELSDAINHRDLSLTFILAMREDFLAELDVFWDKVPALSNNRYRLKKLTLEQAREAIVRPVEETDFIYEPELLEQLLQDLSGQEGSTALRGGTSIEAPYLQIVCNELWQAEQDNPQKMLTLARYNTLGRTRNIVRRHFERGMEKLSLREQVLAFEMSQYLVTARGTKMTYRDEDLADTIGVPVEEVRPILDYLSTREVRILRSDNRPDGFWYELYHDVFAEIIRRWREEFQEDENRRIYGQIVAAARRWLKAGKDETVLLRGVRLSQAAEWTQSHREDLSRQEKVFVGTSSKRRKKTMFVRRTVAGVIVLLAVVAVIFGVFTMQEKKKTERLRFVSIMQSLAAQSLYQQEWKQDERAALLVRQAYLFNQRRRSNILTQIDDALRAVLDTPYFSHILQFDREIIAVAFSPDGQTLAAGRSDGSIQLQDLGAPNSPPLVLRGHLGTVYSVAFSLDSQTLASSGWDKTVRLWNLQNSEDNPLILHDHKGIIFSVAFSPNGRTLASGSSDTTVRLWDLQHIEAEPVVLRGHERGVTSVAFSPDGQTLASGSSDNMVRLWNLQESGDKPLILRENVGEITSLTFSPDGQMLALGAVDDTVRLWNLNDLSAWSKILYRHDGDVTSIAFSPDGQNLASGSLDKTIRLRNLRNADSAPVILQGHDDLVFAVAFDSDGQTLASGSKDGTVRLWDLDKSSFATIILNGHKSEIKAAIFSKDGQTLISAGDDEAVQVWDIAEQNPMLSILRKRGMKVNAIAARPDGQILALGRDDGTVQLLDLRNVMTEIHNTSHSGNDRNWDIDVLYGNLSVLRGHTGSIRSLAFSPDGQTLASGSEDHTVRIWNLKAPDDFPEILHTDGPVFSVAFNSDGETLAAGSSKLDKNFRASATIWMWHRRTFGFTTLLHIQGYHKGPIVSIAFSPDSSMLASGSEDTTIRLWNLQKPGVPSKVLSGHTDPLLSVVFSPDGKTLVSSSKDRTVRIWDLQRLHDDPIILRSHQSRIHTIAFSPDGKRLALGGHDGTLLIRLRTDGLAEEVCQKVRRRSLTHDEWLRFVGKGIPYEQTCPDLQEAGISKQ